MTKNISREYLQKELNKINNLFVSRNFEIVIEKTSSLLKKDPTQVTFYNYIGLSHRQLGQLIKAEQIFKKGLLLFPRATSLLCNLGAVYRQMELFSDAEIIFNRALKINPKNNNKEFFIFQSIKEYKGRLEFLLRKMIRNFFMENHVAADYTNHKFDTLSLSEIQEVLFFFSKNDDVEFKCMKLDKHFVRITKSS